MTTTMIIADSKSATDCRLKCLFFDWRGFNAGASAQKVSASDPGPGEKKSEKAISLQPEKIKI